jgi:predicted nucleic acid-binding protein
MTHGLDTSFVVAVELTSHSRHDASRELLDRLTRLGDAVALAPQVLAEFLHVITDSRRCVDALTITAAIERAERIWNAIQVVQIFPDAAAVSLFFTWMRQHRLGRKRLLDTMLAATYFSAGIRSIATLNRADFDIFSCFTIVEP